MSQPRLGGRARGLRVLAVDDEAPALEDLLYMLRDDPRVAKADGVSDATNALRYVHKAFADAEALDAVFLDLRMPGLNGMDLARVLTRFAQAPALVFVTAYDSHAVEAFALKAVDYLLKPVRRDRLGEAIDRITSVRGPVETAAQPVALPETADAVASPDERISVEIGGVTRFIPLAEVRYAEAHGDYARLHCDSGQFLVRSPMSTLEDRWSGAGFLRIHRRYLVAARCIDELRMDSGRMSVRVGSETLEVSRRHSREVRDLLMSRTRPSTRVGK